VEERPWEGVLGTYLGGSCETAQACWLEILIVARIESFRSGKFKIIVNCGKFERDAASHCQRRSTSDLWTMSSITFLVYVMRAKLMQSLIPSPTGFASELPRHPT
jgi:hypothetical protein